DDSVVNDLDTNGFNRVGLKTTEITGDLTEGARGNINGGVAVLSRNHIDVFDVTRQNAGRTGLVFKADVVAEKKLLYDRLRVTLYPELDFELEPVAGVGDIFAFNITGLKTGGFLGVILHLPDMDIPGVHVDWLLSLN